MIVALITLDLRFQAHSLKEKRTVVKSVLSRMAQRHNLSVYEADYHDFHNRALLAAAWVGPDPDSAQRVLASAIRLAEQAGAEAIASNLEIL